MEVDAFSFDKLPIHDTCWSATVAADGAYYAAACCEHTGGVAAYIVRLDPETDELEYLFDVGEVVGEPSDNGRATQCKVHSSLLPTDDGLLYGTTHLSGPPLGHVRYPHWGGKGDRRHGFRGAMFFVYDVNSRQILDHGMMVPEEGSRCQALDEKRGRIYVAGYPLDHFMIYDLNTRELRDCGRMGSVNPQVIWVDPEGNGYTADDLGRILKFDVEADRLVELNQRMPCPLFQDGWHTVPYDVVAGPDPWVVYGATWHVFPHLFKYDMSDGPDGRMTDLGPAHPDYTGHELTGTGPDHVGGFVFDDDGMLYYCVNHRTNSVQWSLHGDGTTNLVRMDVTTGQIEDFGPMQCGEHQVHYISRGMRCGNGDLVFGGVGHIPIHIYRYRPNCTSPGTAALRKWG